MNVKNQNRKTRLEIILAFALIGCFFIFGLGFITDGKYFFGSGFLLWGILWAFQFSLNKETRQRKVFKVIDWFVSIFGFLLLIAESRFGSLH
jgi:hypothetical protein